MEAPRMKSCPACQTINASTNRFCQQCGRPLEDAAPSAAPHEATVRWSGQRMQVRLPHHAVPVDRLFGGKDHLVIGRAPDCDVCLPHAMVSRYHALLERQPDGLRLRDLASVNGVWVAGRRITEPVLVHDGERVGVGPFLFTLRQGVIHSLGSSRSLRLEAAAGEGGEMKTYLLATVASGLLAVLGAWCGHAAEEPPARLWVHATLEAQGWITSLAFSPNGKVLAASENGDTVHLWDVPSGKRIAAWRHGGNAVAFSPDGKFLAACGDRRIKLWDVAGRREIATLKGDVPVYSAVFSSDGKTLTGVEKGWLTMWSVEKKEELRSIKTPVRLPPVLAYSSIQRPLLAYTHDPRFGSFTLLNATTGDAVLTCDGPPFAGGFAMDRDETTVASVAMDYTIRLWNRTSGLNTSTIKFPPAMPGALALSPDATIVALGSSTDPRVPGNFVQGLRLFKAPKGELLATEEETGIRCLVFSPDGGLLASSSGRTVKLWTVPAAWRKAKE
jgi:WD40 repeat protein